MRKTITAPEGPCNKRAGPGCGNHKAICSTICSQAARGHRAHDARANEWPVLAILPARYHCAPGFQRFHTKRLPLVDFGRATSITAPRRSHRGNPPRHTIRRALLPSASSSKHWPQYRAGTATPSTVTLAGRDADQQRALAGRQVASDPCCAAPFGP
jgi:hypothetical protein